MNILQRITTAKDRLKLRLISAELGVLEEIVDEQRDVLRALAKRRHAEGDRI